jgi:sugar O-acyltransferase (sialic acid O-acetyltransferase NeuD family)
MKQVAIFGMSGCGRSAMPIVREQLAESEEAYELFFVDDNPLASNCNGYPVLTYNQWLSRPSEDRLVNIAIANSAVREKLVLRCEADGIRFFNIRASNVVQFDYVEIGEGSILCPFVTLTSNIRIGRHFHANIYSYVEHDCQIGDFVTFAPGVKCNGNVVIEDHAFIGSGAVIKQGLPSQPLIVGRGAVVGMGAVVTKNVPPGATVVGNPAKPIYKL